MDWKSDHGPLSENSFCKLDSKFSCFSLLQHQRHIPNLSPQKHTLHLNMSLYSFCHIFCHLLHFLNFGTFAGMQIALLLHPSSVVGITHGWHIYLRDVIKYFDLRHLHCYKEITWCYISNVPMAGINYYVIFKK